MFQPTELIQEYEKLNPGEARLSGIWEAIRQADLAKDDSYRLYFRCAYANECREDGNDSFLFHLYLIFPELLALYEETSGIRLPGSSHEAATDAVMDIFSEMVCCADFFYQIPIGDMEKYLEKYKEFCQMHGYPLYDYYTASARLYRQTSDRARAMQHVKNFKALCRAGHCRDSYSLDFIGEMACWYDDLETLQKATKLLEKHYPQSQRLAYEYGRLLYCYAVRRRDTEQAAPYYRLLSQICKKYRMHSPYFSDTIVYLVKTDMNSAWSFFKKEAPHEVLGTTPLYKMEFSIGAEIMMRSLLKQGKETVRLSLPGSQPWQREDGRYQTKELAEYFGKEAREISDKFDLRNGNRNCRKEYGMFLGAVEGCI